jgi:hypothetical protein
MPLTDAACPRLLYPIPSRILSRKWRNRQERKRVGDEMEEEEEEEEGQSSYTTNCGTIRKE